MSEHPDLPLLQQQMPDVPPPWIDASDLLLQAERLTIAPPASGRVATLQEQVCTEASCRLCTCAALCMAHYIARCVAACRPSMSMLF